MTGFEDIQRSDYFLALITESYLKDAQTIAHLRYAIDINKKIIIVQESGVMIPEFLLEGANVVAHGHFSGYIEFEQITEQILRVIMDENSGP